MFSLAMAYGLVNSGKVPPNIVLLTNGYCIVTVTSEVCNDSALGKCDHTNTAQENVCFRTPEPLATVSQKSLTNRQSRREHILSGRH